LDTLSENFNFIQGWSVYPPEETETIYIITNNDSNLNNWHSSIEIVSDTLNLDILDLENGEYCVSTLNYNLLGLDCLQSNSELIDIYPCLVNADDFESWLICINSIDDFSTIINLDSFFNVHINQSISEEIRGCFAFDIAGTEQCFNIVDCEGLSSENLDPNKSTILELYPNPVSEELYIIMPEMHGEIEVFDMNGNIVNVFTEKTNSQIKINMNIIPSGAYIISYRTKTSSYFQSFIKI